MIKENIDDWLDYLLNNKIQKSGDSIYINNDNFFSPNFINGTAGLINILILYSKCFNTYKHNEKIKELLNGIDFNFSKKIDFYTGMSGIGYVFLMAYLFFNKNQYKKQAIEKTYMIFFNKILKNKKWHLYNEHDQLLDMNFGFGYYGIYFFIKNLLSTF